MYTRAKGRPERMLVDPRKKSSGSTSPLYLSSATTTEHHHRPNCKELAVHCPGPRSMGDQRPEGHREQHSFAAAAIDRLRHETKLKTGVPSRIRDRGSIGSPCRCEDVVVCFRPTQLCERACRQVTNPDTRRNTSRVHGDVRSIRRNSGRGVVVLVWLKGEWLLDAIPADPRERAVRPRVSPCQVDERSRFGHRKLGQSRSPLGNAVLEPCGTARGFQCENIEGNRG